MDTNEKRALNVIKRLEKRKELQNAASSFISTAIKFRYLESKMKLAGTIIEE
jgi:hypothetical protein